MAAEEDFLNSALRLAGCAPLVSDINGTDTEAKDCKLFYANLRKALLMMHYWSFAEDRAELTALSAAPLYEFAIAYSLPAGFLRIVEFQGEVLNPNTADLWGWTYYPGRYKIEGAKLLSNEAPVKIVYIKDITDATLWDRLFYETLQAWLASKLAYSVKRDEAKAQSLYSMAMGMLLPNAVAVESQQQTHIPYMSDYLTRGRW